MENNYLNLFGSEFLLGLDSLKILSFNVGIALIINAWVHKQYLVSKYSQILFFQACTMILNILFNYYFINLFGINGAALATLFSAFFCFYNSKYFSTKRVYSSFILFWP